MTGAASLWFLLALPPVLGVLGYGAAAFEAALEGGSTERRVRAALAAPLQEVARLLAQQERRVRASDRLLARSGPVVVVAGALLAALAVPVDGRALLDIQVGIVWFNAMEVLVWAGLWLAGWGANSAFGLIGGYRFVALGLAYELPHMFALITAGLGAESLRLADVAAAQDGLWFAVWMPVAFAAFLLSSLAIAYWRPFDQPLGRDAAGGVLAELSGPDRLLILAGRYMLLAVTAAVGTVLFLGGGGPAALALKTAALLAVLVWAGRRLPTLRVDRLVEVAWVVAIPVTILQALVVAVGVLAGWV